MWNTENIPDQSGKTVLITGANTGIGYHTALAFHQAGASLILGCRDIEKARAAVERIQSFGAKHEIKVIALDLSDLTSVKTFADTVLNEYSSLDVLINNAGVATPPLSFTKQGYELQFGVNFLGHFALTGLLYPLIRTTPFSRIVTLSSMGYQSADINFGNLKSEIGYDRMREYRQSKLANLIFAIELDHRIRKNGDEVISVAAQPGANHTELTRHLTQQEVNTGIQQLGGFMEPWQGALAVLYAAVSADVVGGNMYEPDNGGYRGYPGLAAIQANALDRSVSKNLWDVAEKATGVSLPPT